MHQKRVRSDVCLKKGIQPEVFKKISRSQFSKLYKMRNTIDWKWMFPDNSVPTKWEQAASVLLSSRPVSFLSRILPHWQGPEQSHSVCIYFSTSCDWRGNTRRVSGKVKPRKANQVGRETAGESFGIKEEFGMSASHFPLNFIVSAVFWTWLLKYRSTQTGHWSRLDSPRVPLN